MPRRLTIFIVFICLKNHLYHFNFYCTIEYRLHRRRPSWSCIVELWSAGRLCDRRSTPAQSAAHLYLGSWIVFELYVLWFRSLEPFKNANRSLHPKKSSRMQLESHPPIFDTNRAFQLVKHLFFTTLLLMCRLKLLNTLLK